MAVSAVRAVLTPSRKTWVKGKVLAKPQKGESRSCTARWSTYATIRKDEPGQ
jgi:hypothetical protein